MTMKVFLGLSACAALLHWSKHSRPPRCSAAARLGFRGVPPRARRDQPAADSPDPRNHLSYGARVPFFLGMKGDNRLGARGRTT